MSLALGVYRELLLYEEGGTHLYTAEEFPSPILRPHTPVKGLGMRLGSQAISQLKLLTISL